jgi:uncharacterized protein
VTDRAPSDAAEHATVDRAVLDTNVWLDWLVFADRSTAPIQAAASSGRLIVIATARMRAEFDDVVRRPVIARHGHAPQTLLADFDRWVTPAPEPPRCALTCTDPDDQVFLDLAVAGSARWLVTRDRALLAAARRAMREHGLTIVVPAAFAPHL